MGGIWNAIVEKVLGAAVEKKVAERLAAEAAARSATERTGAAVATEAGAAARVTPAASPAATTRGGASIVIEAAGESTSPGVMSKLWNIGREGGYGEKSWVAQQVGKWFVRGPAKTAAGITAVGVATDVGINGVNPATWTVTPQILRDGTDIVTGARAPLDVATGHLTGGVQALTKKRADAVQAPIDQKELEDQKPRVSDLRGSLAKGEHPGARRFEAAPAARPVPPEDMARRDLADRRALSRRSAEAGALATLYKAAGKEAPAELVGKSTWGRFLAAAQADGTRQLVYETGDRAGRRPAIFRNASGAEVRVDPKDEAFVVSDPRVLASSPGSSKLEIDVFGVQPDGAAGRKLDTIKIETFPAVAPGPERRGDVVHPGARRLPASAPG